MNPRPLAVTILGWLFVIVCSVGLGYHLLPQHIGELTGPGSFDHGLVWVVAIRLLGVVAGAFTLLGHNWARWLLVAWIGYHVGLSALHSVSEVVVHGLLFLVVLFFLFRQNASAFFRAQSAAVGQGSGPDESPRS
jgi:hypothetical protein